MDFLGESFAPLRLGGEDFSYSYDCFKQTIRTETAAAQALDTCGFPRYSFIIRINISYRETTRAKLCFTVTPKVSDKALKLSGLPGTTESKPM